MKKSVLVIAALVAPSVGFAQEARPISLPEAVDLARRNAPGMIQARGTLRTSAMALRQARWAFSPFNNFVLSYGSSIGGGGSYTSDGVFQQRNPTSWGFSQGFGGAELTLWDGGAKMATVRQRGAQVDQAEVGEITQRFSVAQNVKQQYYLILQAREAEAAAIKQIEQATQQLAAGAARVAAGTAVASDTFSLAIQVGNARIALLQAQNNANNANAQLTRLTGSEFPVTAIVSDTADPPTLRLSDAELISLADQGPSVRTSAASLAVTRAQEKGSRAILWPTITASAGYGRSNSEPTRGGFTGYDFGAGPMNYNWNFGISARYTLWNGFARESQLLSASVSTDNAEAQLREAKLLARQNITQQIGNLRTAEAQLIIARANVTSAEEALRIQTIRYQVGAGTLIDVINAQQQLTTARNNLITQRFTLRNSRAQIESTIGRELPQ
ncbi:MAG TPA: TolC family protein [Gemmatimonadaceae bacterium]|nr:TolC family protein [Gemmatimonadaceae bacterium]